MTDWGVLDRPLYAYGEVDRLLDLPVGTARRWIDGYSRRGRQYEPVVRVEPLGPDTPVTWGEFIETYYLSRLRATDRPIPMLEIREAVLRLRRETGFRYVFAHEQVLLADRDLLQLFREIQDEEGVGDLLVEALRSGQLVLIPEARKRLERIEFSDGIAVRVPPRQDIDSIVVAGDTNFGRPAILGTSITPIAVAELVQAGDSIEHIAEVYGLTAGQVTDAGVFSYGNRWRFAA
jgi:uncharacterized protein (DUF433 family)